MMKIFNCPSCGQINTNHGQVEERDGVFCMEGSCRDCNFTWYTMLRYDGWVFRQVKPVPGGYTDTCCPNCQSEDVVGGSIEVDDGCCCQAMTCENCDATWENVYAFSSHVNLVVEEGSRHA